MLIKKYGSFHLHHSLYKPQFENMKKKQFYWTIVASNGQVLATSEMYTRKANAIKGIESASKVIYETYWGIR